MLLFVPLSGLWASLRAKPMEPQSVIPPKYPIMLHLSQNQWVEQFWWFRMPACVSQSALTLLRTQRFDWNLISPLAGCISAHPSHRCMPGDCQIWGWVARSAVQRGQCNACWRPIPEPCRSHSPFFCCNRILLLLLKKGVSNVCSRQPSPPPPPPSIVAH